jgi:hypothetical protein
MDRDLLDKYVVDKTLFRKAIKSCKTNEDLYKFLYEIKSIGGYKLYVPNRWGIPVEDICLNDTGYIHCYFYMIGHRSYKSIDGLSRVVELIKCSSMYDTFTIDFYKK